MKRSVTEKKGCKNRNSQPERIYGLAVSAEQYYFEINYLLSDVYTKDHSSLMADKMLVFFKSDFAYAVKIKYIIAKTTTNASRNSHGNTNVMQWFTASNRLQTITLKMLPNTRAITNEPPR